METRTVVGKKMEDGSVIASFIYCNGGLDNAGQTLVNHYTDSDLVTDLCEVGCLKSIQPSFDESVWNTLDSDEYALYLDSEDYLSQSWEDYPVNLIYLFQEGTGWLYATESDKTFHPVMEM